MRTVLGFMLAATCACGCAHHQVTGTAQNDWATPTGYASAQHPRYINPDAAAHPARNRAVFYERQAPPLQTPPSQMTSPPDVNSPPADVVTPPDRL